MNKNNLSLQSLILSVLSGILLGASFHLPYLYFVAWVSLVPLFFVVTEQSGKEALISGMISGTIWFSIIFYSLIYPQLIFGLPIIIALILVMLLSILSSLIVGSFAVVVNKLLKRYCLLNYLLIPGSWVLLEYIRVMISFKQLPFGILGYSQAYFTYLIQVAELGGVYSISFIVLFINLVIYRLLLSIKNQKSNYKLELVIGLLVVLLVVSYGVIDLNYSSNQRKEQKVIKVGLVQPNIAQQIKWKKNYRQQILRRLSRLTEKLLNNNELDLIIWPETAIPTVLNSDIQSTMKEQLLTKINSWNTLLLTGALNQTAEQIYNQAILFDRTGERIESYSKLQLVLFGEYLPYQSRLPKFIAKLVHSKGAGTEINSFNLQDFSFSTPICSEILNPKLVTQLAANSDFLINISNEAWFQEGNLAIQIWQMAIFRAIENNQPLIKVSNTGLSGIIDAQGRIQATLNQLQSDILYYRLELN
ncbi:MAG: apolipoprotein N-acyltransferase [Bacillota bacterium]